jgi:GT2 family glycosyltransferase
VKTTATLSVVIPNMDGVRWLTGCLGSITTGTRQPIQVIVADDGSSDTSRQVTEQHGATWVGPASRPRTGFAATANRGLRAATGDWVLLLNNDTEFAPDTVEQLERAFARYPDVAMMAPLVLSLRDRITIDSAGMLLFPDATARPRWHGDPVTDVTLRHEEVLVPSGAAALFRRTWLDRVGILDEGMTSYLEDIDLGLRVRRAGGAAVFVPDAVVYHWFSGTMGALSPTKARLIERNHTTVAARHLPLDWLIALPLWTLVRWAALVVTVVRAPRDGQTRARPSAAQIAVALLTGAAEGFARLPRGLRERHELRDGATVTPREWRRLLRSHRAHISDYRRFGADP